ncbi:MAG TPA: hypothetical protein VEB40_00730 [Flavipsychrobacter sp.]|nr:hypothetical protein [Flavipsychrobacter sp.]
MKKVLYPIALLFFFSCNSIENRDKKIINAITELESKDLDKNKLEKVEQVTLLSVDTLTQKAVIYLALESAKTSLEITKQGVDSNLIVSQKEHLEFMRKMGDTPSEIEKQEQFIQEQRDYLAERLKRIDQMSKKYDSLSAEHEKANGEENNILRVQASVVYQYQGQKDSMKRHYLFNMDLKPMTSQGGIKAHRELEELLKR